MAAPRSFSLKAGSEIDAYVAIGWLRRNRDGEIYRVFDPYSSSERALKVFRPHDFCQAARYAEKLERLKGIEGIPRYCQGSYWPARRCHYVIFFE